MTHDRFARWLDAYVEAWRTYDPEAIGALFAADATYRFNPWTEPIRGRDAIVADWLRNPDAPGSWEAAYRPWALDGARGVAVGTSRYLDPDGERTFHNVFLVVFDEEGRCREFTDVYAEER